MEIVFSDERLPGDSIVGAMNRAAVLCVEEEGLEEDRTSVSVTFVTSGEIRELNQIYRDVDRVTDVLSFPLYDTVDAMPKAGQVCLGDVVICTEQALLQADEFGHSSERELVYLFVHSMFHLLGYDHMTDTDKEKMREKEESVMSRLGLER